VTRSTWRTTPQTTSLSRDADDADSTKSDASPNAVRSLRTFSPNGRYTNYPVTRPANPEKATLFRVTHTPCSVKPPLARPLTLSLVFDGARCFDEPCLDASRWQFSYAHPLAAASAFRVDAAAPSTCRDQQVEIPTEGVWQAPASLSSHLSAA
jgi:hypothetical protein